MYVQVNLIQNPIWDSPIFSYQIQIQKILTNTFINYIVLIESTPWYDPSIDTFLLNPYRSTEVPKDMFLREMMVRFQVKRAGIIRAKWGPEVDEFVWKWLYEGPEDD